MKHLRKSILTLLALTLFGGAGAWAQQGPTQVTEFTTDLIASWQNDNSDVTLADMQALGFVAVDASVAQAWTGAPTSGYALLIYGFDGGHLNFIGFDNGTAESPTPGAYTKSGFYIEVADAYVKFFYTGAPNQAIELTKSGANQWTLGQTPDYDLELQVEYYEAHALKEIPAGWTVKVNGVPQTQPYQGDSLMITETDSVTLVPAGNPRRVKSVTLEDEAPAVVEPITVTWNNNDLPASGTGTTFTKDGVTITAGEIDFHEKNFMQGGTFTTTLGNFTKIEVTTGFWNASGTGWSGSMQSATWTGNASSVSFSNDIMGMGGMMGDTQFVFTIQPTN